MKVVNKKNKITKRFDALRAGEPFYYPEEEWYGIVLYSTTDDGENAVDIESGELACMRDNNEVVPLNAEFVIS